LQQKDVRPRVRADDAVIGSIGSAALRQQRREHGAPFFRQPESHRAE
jgi:hypothetical protein